MRWESGECCDIKEDPGCHRQRLTEGQTLDGLAKPHGRLSSVKFTQNTLDRCLWMNKITTTQDDDDDESYFLTK